MVVSTTPAGDDPAVVAFHQLIHRRRDVRGQFTGAEMAPGQLTRLLEAAHAAPSVGLSQPWDFVVVKDADLRRRFKDHVAGERQVFMDSLEADRQALFSGIKIEGIEESTVGLVVTYDPSRGSPHVLGRHAIADAGLYSVCLAIENLWLAATAESLGVGWVSFYREPFLAELLGIPAGVRPVAWLCLGPVTHLEPVPDLEARRWAARRPLEQVVHQDHW